MRNVLAGIILVGRILAIDIIAIVHLPYYCAAFKDLHKHCTILKLEEMIINHVKDNFLIENKSGARIFSQKP